MSYKPSKNYLKHIKSILKQEEALKNRPSSKFLEQDFVSFEDYISKKGKVKNTLIENLIKNGMQISKMHSEGNRGKMFSDVQHQNIIRDIATINESDIVRQEESIAG